MIQRTLALGCLEKSGEDVELYGWIDVRRDHGKLIFFDLRDRSGKVQLVISPKNESLHALAETLRPEWVIWAKGRVAQRPESMQNSEIPTGNIEVQISEIAVLGKAKTPPFDISGDGRDISEELRLKYRYLDLRRSRLKKGLQLRSEFVKQIRNFLYSKEFIEIETPLLTKSTPEGARDLVVPSRLHPGKFYALPQSPQQYKQLLMVAGVERYFQIARCFRDEDTRADRALEFTQVDLEMSFVERKDVMNLVEEMVSAAVEGVGGNIAKKPFPVFSYKEAIEKFGADKFDLRENPNSSELVFAWVINFPVFEKTTAGAWTYSHNPFTSPRLEDIEKLKKGEDIGSLISLQYDLVCNGHEVGGGGIRIHDKNLLIKVFEVIGHSKDAIVQQFGHMLDAFEYGAPPHGGIALGLDRIMMLLSGENAMREVVAFALTGDGKDPMMDAPAPLESAQLKELNIRI